MQGMLGAMQGMMGMTGAASGAAAGGKGAVLVRGFDFGTTPEQINAHMSRAGTVEDVQFVDQGTACVTYSSATEAQVAVVHLQQTIIAGNTRYLDVTLLDPAVFFEGYNIDAEQLKKFYAMSLPQQQAVMAQGSLATARDPTSVLIGRMKKVKAEMAAKSAAGGAVPGGKGCVYVRGFDFATTDEQLAIHMSTVGTVTKVQKIDDGSACVTYSSVEEANLAVQQLQHTTIAGTGSSRYLDLHSMDPEQFLAGHSVDPNTAAQFLTMPHERQQYIIGKGSLATARDPTAVLINRMKGARDAGKGGSFGPITGKGGMGGCGKGPYSGGPGKGGGLGDKERKLEMLLKLVEAMGGNSW